MSAIERITAEQLATQLRGNSAPRLLDARRAEAFRRTPLGIPTAVPVLLDDPDLRLPDWPRDTPLVVYCLCSGQASSTRVALRLKTAGYKDVKVLDGGLPVWREHEFPLAPINLANQAGDVWVPAPALSASYGTSLIAETAFLPGEDLPLQRNMSVLFVDMVDSTRLLFSHRPVEVLRLVQSFMQVVVDIAVQHCGDVHDFEGDGAMLYFAGTGESVPAAFNLRRALQERRNDEPDLPQARFALDTGPLVVGYIGTHERRSLAFIGPSVNTAARILKLAPPEGIVATAQVVARASEATPDLAAQFLALPGQQRLKGFDAPVTIYCATPADESRVSPSC